MSNYDELTMIRELRAEFDERLDEMRESPYWQDVTYEIADAFPSIYTLELVDQWRALGCPDVDDAGLIEGVTDVSRIIAVALYEWASEYLYEWASEAGLN